MTTDNVIDICDNINDLELDFEKWNMLTYDQKKLSDEICIAKYGINNTQFYEQQKAMLLSINEATLITEDSDEALAMKNKLNQTNLELQHEPMAVVIPLIYIDPLELEIAYNKYKQLTQQYKNISNGISLKIWGVTVDEAYEKVKGIAAINNQDEEEEEQISDFIEASFTNIKNILENNEERVECDIKPYDYTNDIPQMVPYLDYTEYSKLFNNKDILISDYINIDDPKKYYDTIKALQMQLQSASDGKKIELENAILKLGWFPYKNINGESIKEARERQAKWFNENMQINIIDMTKYNIDNIPDDILDEAEGVEGDTSRLQPIFISLISTNTFIGKIIKVYTHSQYSHAGIAVSSKLDKIYSYAINTDNKQKKGGFTIESIKLYAENNIPQILLLCIFVDKDVKKKVINELKFYEKNRTSTTYDLGNLLNIAINIKKENKNNSLTMVCSQFVDSILKMAGVDITNKSSNLVTPKTLSVLDPNSTNIYALYCGPSKDYKYKNVDKQIKLLLNTVSYDKLNATSSDNMKNNIQNSNVIESFLEVCTDNEEVNNILREIRSYIAPTSQFEEADINKLCEDNHKYLMSSSHSDLENIAKLLYENRGLQLYINSHDIKDADKLSTVLETDFSMYKNILSNTTIPNQDLSGFAKYYQLQLERYNMKYNGQETIKD